MPEETPAPKNKGGRPRMNPVPAPPPIPATVAEAETQAIQARQSFEFKRARTGQSTAILPGGRRIAAPPFLKARYNMKTAAADLLGAADKVVKESFKREHPGYQYAWPIANANQTQAFIRSGVYEKVPFDALDPTNPLAAVSKTPEGDTMWMQHLLVAISPYWWSELVEASEIESIARASANRKQVEDSLNEQFGSGGFAAEVEDGADAREESVY